MPKYTLKAKSVVDFQFHMNPDLTETELTVNVKSDFGTPTDENDASGMIKSQIRINAKDEDQFNVFYCVIMIYSFDETPDDTEAFLRKIYEKEGYAKVSDDLDALLESMGKPPFKIKDHIIG